MARISLVFVPALCLLLGCGPVVSAAPGEQPAVASGEACVFDDIPFDPHGPIVQGVSAAGADGDACVRLERAPLGDVRRGTEWRPISLSAVVDGRAFDANGTNDGKALAYENSHHNCKDVVSAQGGAVTLTIDGASDDPSVCFSGAPADWRLVLTVNGGSHVLIPR